MIGQAHLLVLNIHIVYWLRLVKHCVDILCCSRVQHPQHNSTIKLFLTCLLIAILQLKYTALYSKLKLFIHCKHGGVACMYKNMQISRYIFFDKIYKIWKTYSRKTVVICKCYNLHLACFEGSSAANLYLLAFAKCFLIDF